MRRRRGGLSKGGRGVTATWGCVLKVCQSEKEREQERE